MNIYKHIKKIIPICLMVMCLLFPFSAWSFDKTPGTLDEFRFAPDRYIDLSQSVVSVVTFGSGMGMVPEFNNGVRTFKPVRGFFRQQGSGVVVRGANGNTYVLTNAHVVTPDIIKIDESTVGSLITFNLKTINQSIYVGSWDEPIKVECTVVWISKDPLTAVDTAILKPVKEQIFLKPIPYEMIGFGQLSGLQKDDSVAIVTGYRDPDPKKEFFIMGIFPDREWYYEARYGKVLSPSPLCFKTESLPWFNMTDVTTNVKIYPGDSGSPVFIFSSGKPILIGLMRAFSLDLDDYAGMSKGFYSYFTPLDELVLRYLAVPGLD